MPRLDLELGAPPPSGNLSGVARDVYRKVARRLARQPGHLAKVDGDVLELYAQSIADYWRLRDEIATEGEVITAPNSYRQANPKCGLRSAAYREALAAAVQLGISPTSRIRVHAKGIRVKEPNPIAQF